MIYISKGAISSEVNLGNSSRWGGYSLERHILCLCRNVTHIIGKVFLEGRGWRCSEDVSFHILSTSIQAAARYVAVHMWFNGVECVPLESLFKPGGFPSFGGSERKVNPPEAVWRVPNTKNLLSYGTVRCREKDSEEIKCFC